MSSTARISGVLVGLLLLVALIAAGTGSNADGHHGAGTSTEAGLIWDGVPTTTTV